EYAVGQCDTPIRAGANCSAVDTAADVPWSEALQNLMPIPRAPDPHHPKAPGIYAGCATCSSGAYRATDWCAMNEMSSDYCFVCRKLMDAALSRRGDV